MASQVECNLTWVVVMEAWVAVSTLTRSSRCSSRAWADQACLKKVLGKASLGAVSHSEECQDKDSSAVPVVNANNKGETHSATSDNFEIN